mgnify:CR=1 FL=1
MENDEEIGISQKEDIPVSPGTPDAEDVRIWIRLSFLFFFFHSLSFPCFANCQFQIV